VYSIFEVFSEPIDFESEGKIWDLVMATCLTYLQKYPSTLDQDMELLKYAEDKMSFNEINCLKIRRNEKVVL